MIYECPISGREIISPAWHACDCGMFLCYLVEELTGYSECDPYLDSGRCEDYFSLTTKEEKIDYIIELADIIIEEDRLREKSISRSDAELVYLCCNEEFRSARFYKLLDNLKR